MRKSFTLIELIIVIAIISILVTLGGSSYTGFQKKARDTRRKNDLEQITNLLNAYYAKHGKYPPVSDSGCGYGSTCQYHSYPNDPSWIPELVPEFAESIPVDPINNAEPVWRNNDNYSYSYGWVSSDGQEYDLTARLENTSDPERCEVKDYHRHWNYYRWCPASRPERFMLYEYSPNSL